MKLATIGLAALLSLGAMGAANAAAGDTEECLAALGALDINGDGYLDKDELAGRAKIDANADSDGDGRISNAEQAVACRAGAVTLPKGKK